MTKKMNQQLTRLEKNLRLFNPIALENLYSGLSYNDIISKFGDEAIDDEIVALYSWRNGSSVSYDEFRTYYNHKANFFPSHIFIDLDESLKQGRQASPHIYLPDDLFGNNMSYIISPFISSIFLFLEAHSRLWLPYRKNLEDNSWPLLYESSRLDDPTEFKYDNLSNLVDHINFMYEEKLLRVEQPQVNLHVSRTDWEISQNYLYESNPFCAELNQICFSEPWPSKYGVF